MNLRYTKRTTNWINVSSSKKYNTSFIKNQDNVIQNSIQSNIPITKVFQVNVTTPAPKVEKITKLKSTSIKYQSSRPEVYVNKQNDSEYTTEKEIVREDIGKQMISDRGRQSKIYTEFSETLKIMNITSVSKNLLARSAISVSSDEIVGDELNSEALIIKVCIAFRFLSFSVFFRPEPATEASYVRNFGIATQIKICYSNMGQ